MTTANTAKTTTTLESFVKDLNNAAKRISGNAQVISTLKPEELKTLEQKLTDYQPKTDSGTANKATALSIVKMANQVISQTAPVVLNADPNFDPLSVADKVAQESVVLELHVRQPGFSKRLKKQTVIDAVTEDKKEPARELKVFRNILEGKPIDDLEDHRASFINFVKAKVIPTTFLGNGNYLVPLKYVEAIDERIQEFKETREPLLDAFEAQYEAMKTEARDRLKDFYDEAQYPPFFVWRAQYRVDARYLSFNAPAALENINKEMHQREKEKVKLQWAETATVMRDFWRSKFIAMVKHFTEKLGKDPETGKNRIFHESAITNINEFCTAFDDVNLTNDTELKAYTEQMQGLLKGVDRKAIKSDEAFRETMEKKMQEFVAKADAMIISRNRKFDLDEDA